MGNAGSTYATRNHVIPFQGRKECSRRGGQSFRRGLRKKIAGFVCSCVGAGSGSSGGGGGCGSFGSGGAASGASAGAGAGAGSDVTSAVSTYAATSVTGTFPYKEKAQQNFCHESATGNCSSSTVKSDRKATKSCSCRSNSGTRPVRNSDGGGGRQRARLLASDAAGTIEHLLALSQQLRRRYLRCPLDKVGRRRDAAAIASLSTAPLAKHYAVGKKVGEGTFGEVRVCRERATGRRFACKTIPMATLTSQVMLGMDPCTEPLVMLLLQTLCEKWCLSTAASKAAVSTAGGSASASSSLPAPPSAASSSASAVAATAAAAAATAAAAAGYSSLVQLHEVLVDARADAVHLILQLCAGGNLSSLITERGRLDEACSAHILKQIAEGAAAMHAAGVVHRDLKPDNILLLNRAAATPPPPPPARVRWGGPRLSRKDAERANIQSASTRHPMKECLDRVSVQTETEVRPTISVRISDFGLCDMARPGDRRLVEFVGSPNYMAVEVVEGQLYGQEVDVWSMGVMLYAMLSGKKPFPCGSSGEVSLEAMKTGPSFDEHLWQAISPSAVDLIRRMLERDPDMRISAIDVLHHPWMVQHCHGLKDTVLAAQ